MGVYYGLAEDEALSAEMEREGWRPWRVLAFALGLAALVAIPTFALVPILGREFTASDLARTALGVCVVFLVAVWAGSAVASFKRRG